MAETLWPVPQVPGCQQNGLPKLGPEARATACPCQGNSTDAKGKDAGSLVSGGQRITHGGAEARGTEDHMGVQEKRPGGQDSHTGVWDERPGGWRVHAVVREERPTVVMGR